jgi:predicted N-acyltransferase
VASAFFLHRGPNLYGRYWGSAGVHDCLHFELCYYLPIEWALRHGFTRFEGGAQGEHKLKRGLMPAACHSSHFIADPALRAAVDDYLARERSAVRQEIELLAAHGPFHRVEAGERPSVD